MDKTTTEMAIDSAARHQSLSVVPRVTAIGGLKNTSSVDALAEKNAADEMEPHTWGRWTAAEHSAFLTGLKIHGREWKKVATCIPTRSPSQIRSHAQKYFSRVSKEKQQLELSALKLQSLAADDAPMSLKSLKVGLDRSPQHSAIVNSIIRNPSSVELRVSKTLASLRKRYEILEAGLYQKKAPDSPDSTLSGCPATLALEMEQRSLREAAEARYELKRRKHSPQTTQQVDNHNETNVLPFVSLASMPSLNSGAFDSSQVLALSQVCSNLVKEKEGNSSIISTIKDDQRSASLQLIREQLRATHDSRPSKVRKTGHSSV